MQVGSHIFHSLFFVAAILYAPSSHAIKRSETLICHLQNGGDFILKSEHDYNPLGALNPHGSSEHNHSDYSVAYKPPKSLFSIETQERVPWQFSRFSHGLDSAENTIMVRTTLCSNGKLTKEGIPVFGQTLIINKNAVKVPLPESANLPWVGSALHHPMQTAVVARGLAHYSGGGTFEGLTSFSYSGGLLTYEMALEDEPRICKSGERPCLIRAVYRFVSRDMGQTWSAPYFSTESEIFLIGATWDAQGIQAIQDRPRNIPIEFYKGNSPQELKKSPPDALVNAWKSKDPYTAVLAILGQEKSIDKQDGGGATPLMRAAFHGNLDLVKELVRRGANTNAFDSLGDSVLTYAARSGNISIVEWLLANGSRLSNDSPLKGSALTSLLALWEGDHQIDVAKYLISKKNIVNLADASGTTPIMYAAGHGLEPLIKLLVQNGADPSIKNITHSTALHYAATQGNPDIVRFLLKNRDQYNAQNMDGKTALHHAAKGGRVDAVAILLKAGADPNLPDKLGASPREYAPPEALGSYGDKARAIQKLFAAKDAKCFKSEYFCRFN